MLEIFLRHIISGRKHTSTLSTKITYKPEITVNGSEETMNQTSLSCWSRLVKRRTFLVNLLKQTKLRLNTKTSKKAITYSDTDIAKVEEIKRWGTNKTRKDPDKRFKENSCFASHPSIFHRHPPNLREIFVLLVFLRSNRSWQQNRTEENFEMAADDSTNANTAESNFDLADTQLVADEIWFSHQAQQSTKFQQIARRTGLIIELV